jgi:hypothetical protein
MAYYPLSQIKTNLYTNGGELVILNTSTRKYDNYVGYYWLNSKGEYFTGKTPQDLPNNILIKIPDVEIQYEKNLTISAVQLQNTTVLDGNPVLRNYLKVYSDTNDITFPPYFNPQLPTQQDYQNAEFRRYFCKKTNEIIYLEIDQTQYDDLINKNPQILWELYEPFNITWQLTGDKQQVAQVNKNMVELASKNQKLPYLNLYLKEDYTKYYQ